MILKIVQVNILVGILFFGVCILWQVLKLRKEVEEVAIMVLSLRLAFSKMVLRNVINNDGSMAGGAGGQGCRGDGAQGGRVILHYNWED